MITYNNDVLSEIWDAKRLIREYVNTILQNHGFVHPENKRRKGGIYLFEDKSGVRYPDFYKKDIVLDAKYKRLGSYEDVAKVGRDDIHQVIAYVNALNAKTGGFVSPLENKQAIIPTKHIKGTNSTLSIFGIEICKSADSYANFCEEMRIKEKEFVESLYLHEYDNI